MVFLTRDKSVLQIHLLSICQGEPSRSGIEAQGAVGAFDATSRILRIGNKLPVCGKDSTVLRERGVAPESVDGVFLAIGGDASVGIGSGVIIGELNGHSAAGLVKAGDGGHKREQGKRQKAGIPHLEE